MQRALNLIALVVIVVILGLAACVHASSVDGASCQNGVCVEVQLSEPIRFNEPVTVTITVETEQDEKDVQIGLSSTNPTVIFEGGPRPWMADTKAHQPSKFIRTIHFPAPDRAGDLQISGGAKTWTGAYSGDDVIVYTTPEEASLDPTILPQTLEPQPTSPGTHSPLATPLPLTERRLNTLTGISL